MRGDYSPSSPSLNPLVLTVTVAVKVNSFLHERFFFIYSMTATIERMDSAALKTAVQGMVVHDRVDRRDGVMSV